MAIEIYRSAPDSWERATLGELVTRGNGSIQTGPFGSQLHASDYVSVGVPCVMPVNIGENRLIREGISCITDEDAQRLSKHILRRGDIVYSRRGDVERRALVRAEEDGWFCGTGCLKVRLVSGVIIPEYAAYYLGHPEVRRWIARHAVGDTMLNLNTSILSAVPFLLPAPIEQEAIAAVLGSLDEKIERNRLTSEAVERLARATFKAWFVDFEPVRAKADGAKSFPGMPAEAFAALPTTFASSPLGPIPEWWEVRPLSSICRIISGGTPKRDNPSFWGGIIPWLSVRDAPASAMPWVYSTEECITEEGLRESAATLVPQGCTIVSARGTVGRLALAARDMTFNQSCYGLMPADGLGYRQLYLQMGVVVSELQQRTHGSVFDTITRQTFESVDVVKPSPEIASSFEAIVAPTFDLLLAQLLESTKLAEVRDYLLPRLLSGTVRVQEAVIG